MENKRILIISPEPWDAIFVSKHHYAIALSESNEVYFLNPPNKHITAAIKITNTNFNKIFVVDYAPFFKGLQYFPAFIRNFIERNFLNKVEKIVNNKIDVIWNFENSRFYDMRFADKRLKIYHQVDLNQNFHIKEATTTADICFCTTDFIKEKISENSDKVFKIHHGVSSHIFENKIDEPLQRRANEITAAYIGNMDIPYLDVELLEKVIIRFTEVTFKFIGSYKKDGKAYSYLSKYPNVIFTGKVNNIDIIKYLKASDILLVCYKADEFKQQLASPHKMMEYFASGKPIVATYTDEYKDKSDLLFMSKSSVEFPDLLKYVINNLVDLNSEKRQQVRIEFAKNHTYKLQLKKIIELIQLHVVK